MKTKIIIQLCLEIETSLKSKSRNKKRESTCKRKGIILFSESENNKPTSGTNSGVLGPVAFWMIVWMSASVKSSQGSTSCTTNHVFSKWETDYSLFAKNNSHIIHRMVAKPNSIEQMDLSNTKHTSNILLVSVQC